MTQVGDQLELDLGMPWNGYDPRSLTRVGLKFSLASEGTGRSIQLTSHVDQLQLFPEEKSFGTP